MKPAVLEICVDTPDGVAAAVAGGADRIELCAALEVGGLTPSAGLVATAVDSGIPIHAMIRPRAGGFCYSAQEVRLMTDDIARLRDWAVAGVVVGATTEDGILDPAVLTRFRRAADGMAIVLHRAIDVTEDPVAGTRLAGELGFDLILSSGGARTALDGAETLARMVAIAPPSLQVIAGSGVTADNVVTLMDRTGVRQIHASASRSSPVDEDVLAMGFGSGVRRITDPAAVAALKAAIRD